MAQIVTKTGENTITFDAYYQYIWARNYGETDVYISNHADIVAGDDDVALLPAGEAIRLTVNGKTLYVLGSTTLEVHAQNYSDSPFAWNEAGEGGGSDITVVALSATENTTYTAPSGTAYSPVTVNVPTATLGTKTITQDGTYNASSDNLDGYSSVTVDTAYHLPDGYTQLDYVETPSSGQAGFEIATYTSSTGDIHETKTMPYQVQDEAGFAGKPTTGAALEFYYSTGKINIYTTTTTVGSEVGTDMIGERNAVADTAYVSRVYILRGSLSGFNIGYYNPSAYLFNGRIYYYRIYSGSSTADSMTLLYNFIPCKRNSDNKIGFYETVNDIFYSSTTGTEFVAPASV